MPTGSYAMSLRDRADKDNPDPQLVGGTILNVVGAHPGISLEALASRVDFPSEHLRKSIQDLLANEFIQGDNQGYKLTDWGERARSVVAR